MSAETTRAAAAARGLTATPKIEILGDHPGSYAAACDECQSGPLGSAACGTTRYFKRDAKRDLLFHRGAHDAWIHGIRSRAWPTD